MIDDACGPDGAQEIASAIIGYWRLRGYRGIRAWVSSERGADGHHLVYCVRSNIGPSGYPPLR